MGFTHGGERLGWAGGPLSPPVAGGWILGSWWAQRAGTLALVRPLWCPVTSLPLIKAPVDTASRGVQGPEDRGACPEPCIIASSVSSHLSWAQLLGAPTPTDKTDHGEGRVEGQGSGNSEGAGDAAPASSCSAQSWAGELG